MGLRIMVKNICSFGSNTSDYVFDTIIRNLRQINVVPFKGDLLVDGF